MGMKMGLGDMAHALLDKMRTRKSFVETESS